MSGLVGADGQPIGTQQHLYPIGPFAVPAIQSPPELVQLGFGQGDPKAMIYATWACTSVAFQGIAEFLGRTEIRLSALEKVLNKNPEFKAAYEQAAKEVDAEMKQKHAAEMAQAQQAQAQAQAQAAAGGEGPGNLN